MTDDEVIEHIEALRQTTTDTANVEAKRSEKALPKSIRNTLSSFSNTAGGGVVLLGVNEASGFPVTGVDDPKKVQADLSSMCAEMVPPVRPMIASHAIEGKTVIVAEVPELTAAEKPCYYGGAGMSNGSYVRVGDADQRLSQYEVQMMIASRGRSENDLAPVSGATLDDLDPDLIAAYCGRVRERIPHVFGRMSDEEVLRQVRALVSHEGAHVPSIAGLLSLGTFPQRFFPNLNLTFVHYPTPEAGELGPGGERFLDEAGFIGPVPKLISDALYKLRAAMTKAAFGGGSYEQWEYPQDALRECIVNALVHRDLSPASHGTSVQIELYPDRLLVRNPGGLFGPITIDQLGDQGVSSTRNEALVRILEDAPAEDTGNPVCQNRGSGLMVMLAALRAARLRPPQFRDRISNFEVAFSSHSLLDPETVTWLVQFSELRLTSSQQTALAYARGGEALTNAIYRRLSGIDSRDALRELAQLVDLGVLRQEGVRGGTEYVVGDRYAVPSGAGAHALADGTGVATNEHLAGQRVVTGPRTRTLREVYDLFDSHKELGRAEIEKLLSITSKSASYRLDKLIEEGWLMTDAPVRSPTTKYRRTAS